MECIEFLSALIRCSTMGVLAIAAQGPATCLEGAPLAEVTIHVVDEYGVTVQCEVKYFYRRGHDQTEMVSHFRGSQGTAIPYDMYGFTVKRLGPGALNDEVLGTVAVFSPQVLLTVPVRRKFTPGASMDIARPAGYLVRGRLQPAPGQEASGEQIWIRLSPIFQKDHLDVGVDSSGAFRIYDILVGRYVLSVIRGEEVLHVQQVEFGNGEHPANFVVNMVDPPGAVLQVRP